MAWTAPKTWVVGEPLTAPDLNAYMRDNMLALKTPPTALVKLDELSDYTTTSTAFVAVDVTRLSHTLVTTGGDVMIVFFANISNTSSYIHIDIEFDGVLMGGDNGLGRSLTGNYPLFTLVCLKTSVAAGSHTIRVMWKVVSGTATLYAGTTLDVHPMFWVREI